MLEDEVAMQFLEMVAQPWGWLCGGTGDALKPWEMVFGASADRYSKETQAATKKGRLCRAREETTRSLKSRQRDSRVTAVVNLNLGDDGRGSSGRVVASLGGREEAATVTGPSQNPIPSQFQTRDEEKIGL
jgi:hypothetical protein